MISIRQGTIVPPTLRADGLGGKRIGEWIAGYPATTDFWFDDYWNRPDVRGALYASQGRVCAYCGCELHRGNRGDVDHFRPKSHVAGDGSGLGYWWLTYDCSNYFLSCRTCNSTYKQNKFPLEEGQTRIRFETRDSIANEARLLLDPYADQIEQLLRVDLSNLLVPVVPTPGLSGAQLARVMATLEFFSINYQPELTRARMKVADRVRKAIAAGRPERVRSLAIRYRPNSMVARQLLEENARDVMPTPSEELGWLLRDMYRTLQLVLQHRLVHDTDRLKTDQDELLWSFAFLLTDPPAGFNAEVGSFVTKHRIGAFLDEKQEKLQN